MDKKNYVGSGKAIQNNYGEMLNISVNVAELAKFQNEKWYAKLTITKRKEPDQYGNTHSVVENTWKPTGTSTPTSSSYGNVPF